MNTNTSALPNVVVLSCLKGGNGHESARQAIEQHFGDSYRFNVVYPFQSIQNSMHFDLEAFYNRIFQMDQIRLINSCTGFCVSTIATHTQKDITRLIESALHQFHPIFVISLAPIFNRAAIATCARRAIPYCLITLDGDLTTWSAGMNGQCDAQSRQIARVSYTILYEGPKTKDLLVSRGIDPERIHTIGIPIRREFQEDQPSREVVCQQLGLPEQKKIVLMMSGGSGGKCSYVAAKSLFLQPLGVHFVVIAGRNERLESQVQNLSIHPMNSLTVLGFTEPIARYMRVAHILVTKPGPNTLFEAATLYRKYQTPFLLMNENNCLFWERPNMRMAEKSGFGEPFRTTKELAAKVASRLSAENPPLRSDPMPKESFCTQLEPIFEALVQDAPPRQRIS